MLEGHVAILMATYCGEKYLPEQLNSIFKQSYGNFSLWVSDDGSTDNTRDVLARYAGGNLQRLHVFPGPQQGFAKNFLSLLQHSEINADFYAFADQDDVWHADKIERAIAWLSKQPSEQPALYCSRTFLVDEAGRGLGDSPLFARPPCFSNALVQSIGGGNTMVFNQAARTLLCLANKDAKVVSHDWWLYIIVAGAGGCIYYDPRPSIDYRQHGANLIGSNLGWRARLKRIRLLLKGRFRDWNALHMAALSDAEPFFTPENRLVLSRFRQARISSLPKRLWCLYRSGAYRQTLFGNVGLWVAATLNRL